MKKCCKTAIACHSRHCVIQMQIRLCYLNQIQLVVFTSIPYFMHFIRRMMYAKIISL